MDLTKLSYVLTMAVDLVIRIGKFVRIIKCEEEVPNEKASEVKPQQKP